MKTKKFVYIISTTILIILSLLSLKSEAGLVIYLKGFMNESGPDWQCVCPATELEWDCFYKIILPLF